MGRLTQESMQRTERKDARYWLYETPEIYETGKNTIRYYKNAGKIQIALPDYTEAKEFFGELKEERKPGKLSALDLEALSEDPETLQWLIDVLEAQKV